MSNSCPFCSPAQPVVAQTDTVQVLLSNPRKVPGHFLVMPKRHVEKPWELTDQEITEIFKLIGKIEQKIIGVLGEGCDVRQNYRPFIKQGKLKVDHVHYHVIPRSPDDYIYTVSERFESELWAELDQSEHDEVAKLLDA